MEFPADAAPMWFSAGAKRFGWQLRRNNQDVIVMDGKDGPAFDKTMAPQWSKDGQRWAYLGKRLAGWVVMTDAGEGPVVDEVAWITFTHDGRLAYSAKRRNKWAVMVDGKEGPEFDGISTAILPEDGRLIFAGKRGQQWVVSVNGTEGPLFDEISPLQVSPDHRRLVYAGRRAKNWLLVADGTESPTPGFEQISLVTFSPDSQHLAYAGRRIKIWHLVVDGKQGPPFEDLSLATFSPDSQRLAYAGKRLKKWVLMLDGAEGLTADRLAALTFSRDSRRLAYAAGREKPGMSDNIFGSIVVDGKEGAGFEGEGWRERKGTGLSGLLASKIVSVTSFTEDGPIVAEFTYSTGTGGMFGGGTTTKFLRLSPRQFGVSAPVFSGDGARVAYSARRSKDESVVFVDAEPGPAFSMILSTPVFSPDGRHVAYVALQAGKIVEVLDGKPVAELQPRGGVNFVEQVAFSADGQRRAYVLGVGGEIFTWNGQGKARRCVVVDGQAHKEYDVFFVERLAFSADNRHLAYLVRGVDGKSLVVVDGQEGKPYDVVSADESFADGAGNVTYLASLGHSLYRVTQGAAPR